MIHTVHEVCVACYTNYSTDVLSGVGPLCALKTVSSSSWNSANFSLISEWRSSLHRKWNTTVTMDLLHPRDLQPQQISSYCAVVTSKLSHYRGVLAMEMSSLQGCHVLSSHTLPNSPLLPLVCGCVIFQGGGDSSSNETNQKISSK